MGLMTYHLPKAPPPNAIILGIRFQHMNFRGIHLVYGILPLAPKIYVLLTCKTYSFHPPNPKSLNLFQHQF